MDACLGEKGDSETDAESEPALKPECRPSWLFTSQPPETDAESQQGRG